MVKIEFSEEELRKMYLDCNMSFLEVAERCGVTGPQLRQVFKKYGIVKPRSKVNEVTRRVTKERYGVESTNQLESVKERKKKSFLSKYGVENPMQIPEVYEKNIKKLTSDEVKQKRKESLQKKTAEEWKESAEKAKKTKEEKYGKDYNTYFREKAKQTLLAKYGVPYSIEGHEKMKKTNLERYGVEQYRQSREALEQIKKTKFERYGGWFNQEAIQQTKLERYGDPFYNNREKARLTNREKFGVDWYCTLASEDSPTVASRPNERFAEFLQEREISFEREFNLEGKRYDFKIGNCLIEINPSATHNSTFGIRNNPKPVEYHYEKSEIAWKNGYECIHVWDWTDWEDVIHFAQSGEKVYFQLSSEEDPGMLLKVNLNFFSGKDLEKLGFTETDDTEPIFKVLYDLNEGEVLNESRGGKGEITIWTLGAAYFYVPDKTKIQMPDNIKIINVHTEI